MISSPGHPRPSSNSSATHFIHPLFNRQWRILEIPLMIFRTVKLFRIISSDSRKKLWPELKWIWFTVKIGTTPNWPIKINSSTKHGTALSSNQIYDVVELIIVYLLCLPFFSARNCVNRRIIIILLLIHLNKSILMPRWNPSNRPKWDQYRKPRCVYWAEHPPGSLNTGSRFQEK